MPSTNTPRAFHIMAKPTGSACNLHCDYCFFLKKEKLYPGSNFHMSKEGGHANEDYRQDPQGSFK